MRKRPTQAPSPMTLPTPIPDILMRLTLILALSTLTAGALAAEKPAEIPPQQKESEKMNAEYVAAFGRADDKALAAFYTEDADQTDGEGNEVLSGRAAIEKQLKDYFAANKDAVIELHTDSVRLLAAEVVLEKGEAEVTQADGVGTRSNYVAVHVKREGKWLIAHLTEVVAQSLHNAYLLAAAFAVATLAIALQLPARLSPRQQTARR